MMYKEGIRWTEFMESEIIGKHDVKYMVLDYILTISTTIDHPHNYQEFSGSSCDPGYFDYDHHISGAWSHELQQECPAGKQHEQAQYARGDNELLSHQSHLASSGDHT